MARTKVDRCIRQPVTLGAVQELGRYARIRQITVVKADVAEVERLVHLLIRPDVVGRHDHHLAHIQFAVGI